MPAAQRARLIVALEEYIKSYEGDTGNPRTGLRGAIDPSVAADVKAAQTCLSHFTQEGADTSAEARNTPGSRSRDSVSQQGATAAQGGSANSRARAMLGAG